MTPEQQRIAIAEACGWEVKKDAYLAKPPNGDWQYLDKIPDYLNDLNAMHETEESLGGPTDFKWSGYCTHLLDVCGEMGSRIHATAAQRAEAFLKTIDKWEDIKGTSV